MFKRQDPNSWTAYYNLFRKTDQIGYLIAEYTVSKYDDVQVQSLASLNKAASRNFIVHCTQRIVVSNTFSLIPAANLNSYDNYPALINTILKLTGADGGSTAKLQVLDYSPKTVNTKVQQSGSTGDDQSNTNSISKSNTVGSSTAVTNSYGFSVSATVGLTDASETVSANFEHSSTNTSEQSSTSGSDFSAASSRNTSASASMSVKDWGAYGMVNPLDQSPHWVFGQEYPWDAIQCLKTKGTTPIPNQNDPHQVQLVIPSDVSASLWDSKSHSLLPPSQLSLFGVNFAMKVVWLVTLDNTASDTVLVKHDVFYSRASHASPNPSGDVVAVYVDSQPAALNRDSSGSSIITPLNLPLLALDVMGSAKRPAIIGFIPNKFTVPPAPSDGKNNTVLFNIISSSNTLMILDTTTYPAPAACIGVGFTAGETALSASFTSACTSLSMTAYFKIVDSVNEYKLYMKHWKTGGDVKLTLIINGYTENALVKYVDAQEAAGGEANLLVISLRDFSYASIDYHDYLQLGLNSIQITIEPVDTSAPQNCGYQIRAVSIEQE